MLKGLLLRLIAPLFWRQIWEDGHHAYFENLVTGKRTSFPVDERSMALPPDWDWILRNRDLP